MNNNIQFIGVESFQGLKQNITICATLVCFIALGSNAAKQKVIGGMAPFDPAASSFAYAVFSCMPGYSKD